MITDDIRELKDIKFSVTALIEKQFGGGSYQQANADNAALGIRHRIDRIIDSLESLDAIQKNEKR